MRLVCLALVACQAEKPAPAPAVTPKDAAPPAVIPIDAAVIKRDVPPTLAAAPKWIGRRLMTGAVNRVTEHFTFTLQRDGGQALLTIEKRRAKKSSGGREALMPERIDEWELQSTEQFIGTIEETGDVVTITVKGVGGGDKRDFRCKRTTIAAAPADAVRARSPGTSECGDEGRWVPATTKPIEVIRCIPFEEKGSNEWARLAFAAAPGIEWLHINDDCVIQGGGWRLVPPDGGIGTLRKKR